MKLKQTGKNVIYIDNQKTNKQTEKEEPKKPKESLQYNTLTILVKEAYEKKLYKSPFRMFEHVKICIIEHQDKKKEKRKHYTFYCGEDLRS